MNTQQRFRLKKYYRVSDLFPFYQSFSLQSALTVTGKNVLLIWYITDTVRDFKAIECMHFKVADLTAEILSLQKEHESEEKIKELEQIVTSSSHESVQFDTRDDSFIATTNWIRGIAEMGLDRLLVEQHIDNPKNIIPTILNLLYFMFTHDHSVFSSYLDLVEKSCRFEDDWHLSSLKQNLSNIITIIADMTDTAIQISFLRDIASRHYPDDAFIHSESTLASLYNDPTIRLECGRLRMFQYAALWSKKDDIISSARTNLQIYPFNVNDRIRVTLQIIAYAILLWLLAAGILRTLEFFQWTDPSAEPPTENTIDPKSSIGIFLSVCTVLYIIIVVFGLIPYFVGHVILHYILDFKCKQLDSIFFFVNGTIIFYNRFWKTRGGILEYDGTKYPIFYHTFVTLDQNQISTKTYHKYVITCPSAMPSSIANTYYMNGKICTLQTWDAMAKSIHPDLEGSDFSKVKIYGIDGRDITQYMRYGFYS